MGNSKKIQELKKSLCYTSSDIAKILGISSRAVNLMKTAGHLPKQSKIEGDNPKLVCVHKTYVSGFDLQGKPLKTKADKVNLKPKMKATLDKEQKKIAEMMKSQDVKLANMIKNGFNLDQFAEQLMNKMAIAPTDNLRKIIMQTLVGVEQYKKLQVETEKKKGEVIDKEQVVYFFNKYFNALNESLIELPSIDLAEKVLGEVRMLEKRKKPKKVILNLFEKYKKLRKDQFEEELELACIEIESKVDDTAVKLKIQDILEKAISRKVQLTHEAIKKHELFIQDDN